MALFLCLGLCTKWSSLLRLQHGQRPSASVAHYTQGAAPGSFDGSPLSFSQKGITTAWRVQPLTETCHTAAVFLLTPLIILSGLALSPQMDVAFNWLPAMFGGGQAARTFHFLATFLFLLFTFGHVLMVLAKGPINNMRSIITGWHTQKIPDLAEPGLSQAVVEKATDDDRAITETKIRLADGEGKQVKEGIKNEGS